MRDYACLRRLTNMASSSVGDVNNFGRCSDSQSEFGLHAAYCILVRREVIPMLERDDDIEMYAWNLGCRSIRQLRKVFFGVAIAFFAASLPVPLAYESAVGFLSSLAHLAVNVFLCTEISSISKYTLALALTLLLTNRSSCSSLRRHK